MTIAEAQNQARALLSPDDAQDLRDGWALRRLREALHERGIAQLDSLGLEMVMTTGGTWRVSALSWGHRNGGTVAKGMGATLAEAADRCREGV